MSIISSPAAHGALRACTFRACIASLRGAALAVLALVVLLAPVVADAAVLYQGIPVSDPADGADSINFGNTSRNLAVGADGTIFAVYHGATGIWVARSSDRGASFEPGVQVNAADLEAEIAVSSTGIVYVAWVSGARAMVTRSLDDGSTFSTPVDAGAASASVHMAVDGSRVYLIDRRGTRILVSSDNGQSFTTVTTGLTQAYADIHVDRTTGQVIAVLDNPAIKYLVSSDFGVSFGPQINPVPGGSIYYSVGTLSTGEDGRWLIVAGGQLAPTAAIRINLDTNASEMLVFGANSSAQGRSLAADSCGNIVDGYVNAGNVEYRISPDLGNTFSAATIVAASNAANVFINPTNGDLLYLYESGGAVFLNVYAGELGNCYNPAVSTNSLAFSALLVGQTSGAQQVVLSNPGTVPVEITGVTTAGDFAQTSNCVGTLAIGASCTVDVTFSPTAVGTRNGQLLVQTDASGTPRTVLLTGEGVENAPVAVLSPSTLAFGEQVLGQPGTALPVTLSNNGTEALTINGFAISGPFSYTSTDCGATLAASASCTLQVTYQPTVLGPSSGTLLVDSDSAGAPTSTALSGTAVAPSPGAVLAPLSIDFGDVLVGAIGTAQVTLTNDGTAPLVISGYSVAAPFAVSGSDCGASLDAGSSCLIDLQFAPAADGAASGTLVLQSNAATAPEVALAGRGVSSLAVFDPAAVDFGDVRVGTGSALVRVTLRNDGTGPLAIAGFTTSAPFGATVVDCGASLAAGSACSVDVQFSPTAVGAASGTLSLQSDAATAPEVALAGAGVSPLPVFDPTAVDFGSVLEGTTSAPSRVTLRNDGTGPLAITGFDTSGPFASVDVDCGASLAAGMTCSVDVRFSPAGPGAATGTLALLSDADSQPSVALQGSGEAALAQPAFSQPAMVFGEQTVDTVSDPQSVQLVNNGTASLDMATLQSSGPFLVDASACGPTLAVGASCVVTVQFAPQQPLPANGSIQVGGAGAGTATVTLTGLGITGLPAANPGAIMIPAASPWSLLLLCFAVCGVALVVVRRF